jgi:hypothetical protein
MRRGGNVAIALLVHGGVAIEICEWNVYCDVLVAM